MTSIRIGTRGSRLALWQANHAKSKLEDLGYEVKIIEITTKGDISKLSFDKIEGKGFFTKEIEDALLQGDVDIAVHSMKDLPTTQPDGLVLAGVSERANPRDFLLVHPEAKDAKESFQLKQGALVGTSSARRKAQMKSLRGDVAIKDIRGNVPTRINKLRDGTFDAILLAAAGLERLSLDISDLHVVSLHPHEFVPAPAQGIVAYQCRNEDLDIRRILKRIHHSQVAYCSNVERSVLKMMDGGCHMPLGVHCYKDATGNYHCHAAYASSVSEPLIRVKHSQSTHFGLAEKVFQLIQERI